MNIVFKRNEEKGGKKNREIDDKNRTKSTCQISGSPM
jgi:hypothetical protein